MQKYEKTCERGDRFHLFFDYIQRGHIKLKGVQYLNLNNHIPFNLVSSNYKSADLARILRRG